jgi:glycosyltransferase involved in cell wall biosynthesis
MNVLFISYDGMTDPLGQSQVIPYLQGLVKKGYKIHLLSCEKQNNFKLHEKKIRTILLDSGIEWEPIFYTKYPPVLSTFWDVLKLKRKAFRLHVQESFDVVHCRSYIAALVGQVLKEKFKIKFIFDIRGFWADERVDGGLWDTKNPVFKFLYFFFKRKEKQFFEIADAVVTLTNASKNYILNSFDVTSNITVIPCAADLNLFKPQKLAVRDEYRKKLNVADDFVLLYLGSVGTWYLLDEMLDFFTVLKKKNASAKFVFISGDDSTTIINKAKSKGIIETDIIVKSSARTEVPKWISIADLSVFFIKDCFSKMASSPTKHGELLGVNVPVICNDIGDLKEVISFKDSGLLTEGFDVESYQKSIDTINLSPDAVKSKLTSEHFYSLENGIKKYQQVYDFLR